MSQMSNAGGILSSNLIAMPFTTAVSGSHRTNIIETRDAPDDATTNYRIGIGDTFSGNLDTFGDRDWVAINLTDGARYKFDLMGAGSGIGTLSDAFLYLYDSKGNLIDTDDDGGTGSEASMTFTADVTGTYYLSAASYSDNQTGTYRLAAERVAPASLDRLATYLTDGFWKDQGEPSHAFDTSASNRISADISGLTVAGQQLARWAMQAWEMVANIDFRIVNNSNAQVVLDDQHSGAYSTSNLSGGRIIDSFVNIGTSWLTTYGATLDSYSFQTYLHELGHALGLGHQGNYNGYATYGVDEDFINDSWQLSVMSYFSQTDNTTVSADYATLLTTMMADNIAIQSLYGRPGGSSPTAGNTVWGANSNLSGYMGHFADYLADGNGNGHFSGTTPVALTIFDRGGRDTLNLSFSTGNDRISLRQETFSDIDGVTGNLGISRGTVIENLIAGSGNDFIQGNGVSNKIKAGAGNDTVRGGYGADQLFGGDGYDTLLGESGNDILHGHGGNDSLLGHAGDDVLYGGGRADRLRGGNGEDRLYGETGNDVLFGGAGRDKLSTGAGNDRAYGGSGKDYIFGGTGNDAIFGDGGNDRLFGDVGADTLTGGGGRDTLIGGGGADMFLFSTGDGHDVIKGFSRNDTEDISLTQIIAINNFADLVNNHLRNAHGDAMIVYGTGSILLAGVNFGDIGFGRAYDADDFIF
ncbi:M10 family metallopeptidase C-terminal domain-containing protein [Paracoccus onubensis]|uniref:M10 family metallopeptidase C-terminal domain-containing protein n=1 Tax=Paracoccus onubensis TaxID=1675788 RepID=UPI0027305A40|nr:M10 family metallopeptidase C-terminal domain-containing protein [Paracoccus onubensis]MDP0929251.1 M10 family metallopeptidase C-terminal domain-containing protein [Paracoccus onubensis]